MKTNSLAPESRFTKPRHDCPRPERWSSMDPDSTEIEVSRLVAAFVTALQPDFVIETGTAWGQTALLIGEALRENGQGELFTLEPNKQRAEFCRDLLVGLPVNVVEKRSDQWSPHWTPGSNRTFCWLDSLLHLRIDELIRFRPWLPKGSIVGMHDTGPHHALLPKLTPWVKSNSWVRMINLPTPRGVSFLEILS